MKKKSLVIILTVVLLLLAIPLIAMQFSAEVDWKLPDFVLMGALLFGTGMLIELVVRKVRSLGSRIALCAAIVFLFLLVWAELAVGIFGTPFAGS